MKFWLGDSSSEEDDDIIMEEEEDDEEEEELVEEKKVISSWHYSEEIKPALPLRKKYNSGYAKAIDILYWKQIFSTAIRLEKERYKYNQDLFVGMTFEVTGMAAYSKKQLPCNYNDFAIGHPLSDLFERSASRLCDKNLCYITQNRTLMLLPSVQLVFHYYTSYWHIHSRRLDFWASDGTEQSVCTLYAWRNGFPFISLTNENRKLYFKNAQNVIEWHNNRVRNIRRESNLRKRVYYPIHLGSFHDFYCRRKEDLGLVGRNSPAFITEQNSFVITDERLEDMSDYPTESSAMIGGRLEKAKIDIIHFFRSDATGYVPVFMTPDGKRWTVKSLARFCRNTENHIKVLRPYGLGVVE